MGNKKTFLGEFLKHRNGNCPGYLFFLLLLLFFQFPERTTKVQLPAFKKRKKETHHEVFQVI